MIAAFANGGKILRNDKYISAAESAADFILDNLIDHNGRLFKRYRKGASGLQPHIDDYAFFIWGLLNLYEAGFKVHYLQAALEIAELMVNDFLDKENEGFLLDLKVAKNL